MPNIGDTGNGATFTLTTQTAAASLKIEKISIAETSVDMLDVSVLSTATMQERIVSDLQKPGDVTLDVVFNQAATAITISGAVDTATITFPVGPAQTTTTAATYAFTGYVTKIKLPDLQNGAVMKGQIVLSPDGDTGPTYTRGA